MKTGAFLSTFWRDFRTETVLMLISAAALAASLLGLAPGGVDPAWAAIALCGLPIIKEAAEGLFTRLDVKADLLVSLALISSVVIGEYFAAGEVALIMQIGALLEEATVARARAGVERLAALKAVSARVVTDGRERVIPADDVTAGDVVRVLPGELLPVDGVVTKGETSIDESALTGEPMPVDKRAGDRVLSGSINRFGAIDVRAEGVGENSTIARMARLVAEADAGRARIVRLADRWATWIVFAALTAAAAVWLVTGEEIRAVTILVVFCPCALVLATPTAVMAAIGRAASEGALVREGDALERLAEADRIAFDKTGTLTEGRPRISAVLGGEEMSEADVSDLAAAAESLSEHPLGRTIAAGRTVFGRFGRPEDFRMSGGSGVRARIPVEGGGMIEAAVGRLEWLVGPQVGAVMSGSLADQAATLREGGATLAGVAADGRVVGLIALADEIRPGAAEAVRAIDRAGVSPMLMTGDHREAALRVAAAAGIRPELVVSECLPETKLERLDSLERADYRTAMVGDGINDAPALRRAWVGIAMGGAGSDIAVSSAGIVLMRDELSAIPRLIALSRRMMRMIRFNITLAMGINFAAILLAATGLMGPVAGALVHNAGSVAVILNSARLLGRRREAN